jgi:hypothetical protein
MIRPAAVQELLDYVNDVLPAITVPKDIEIIKDIKNIVEDILKDGTCKFFEDCLRCKHYKKCNMADEYSKDQNKPGCLKKELDPKEPTKIEIQLTDRY